MFMSGKVCFNSINDMLPTGVPKCPWITIGSVGCTITDTEMQVLFDDGSWLIIKIDN